MSEHGNSYQNEKEHHLYEVFDTEKADTFKYGINDDPLNVDGSSPRANEQAKFLNRAVRWDRFVAYVLVALIPGRRKARQIEDDYVEKYLAEKGHYPPGNEGHKKYRG